VAGACEEFPGVEWVEGAGEFIKVVEERCSGCAYCVRVCLGGCYEISGKVARIRSLESCMECAACWYVCPEDAVDFNWPPGGKGFRSDWG
jgi:NAD-dependent dihydropyrimidine dehydrogenase PreA subunit